MRMIVILGIVAMLPGLLPIPVMGWQFARERAAWHEFKKAHGCEFVEAYQLPRHLRGDFLGDVDVFDCQGARFYKPAGY